ncbi:MAG: hypothetical protein OEV87_11575 [Phycisphaerae bacterium]|nr:hypothetical protein [Phycisphaerae bacterium]
MSCCGENIIKVGKIAEGTLRYFLATYFRLPTRRYGLSRQRLMACRQCDNKTWIKKWQFGLWVMRNGGLIQFAKDIKDLIGWTPLPD